MNMVFRWYGEKNDTIPLEYIPQIPNVNGIVTALHHVPVGQAWDLDEIMAVKKQVNDAGLTMEVIESVNIHEDIKLGAPSRDEYIENYISTIKNLSAAGVKCICYNFMPIFDWLRTDLAKPLDNGSTVMYYSRKIIDSIADPLQMVDEMQKGSNGFLLPGWEPERLGEFGHLFEAYADFDEDKLYTNLKYFLDAIIPICEKYDVKMAIHPDDPPENVFGLPRIVNSKKNIKRLLELNSSVYNGLTLCTGSLGANPDNNIPEIASYFAKKQRIHFAHIRNIKFYENGDFGEVSHLSSDGSLDMYAIVKALYNAGFNGYARPDHGRMIWNEKGRPGYGLYDRALGIAYLNGILEAITKGSL